MRHLRHRARRQIAVHKRHIIVLARFRPDRIVFTDRHLRAHILRTIQLRRFARLRPIKLDLKIAVRLHPDHIAILIIQHQPVSAHTPALVRIRPLVQQNRCAAVPLLQVKIPVLVLRIWNARPFQPAEKLLIDKITLRIQIMPRVLRRDHHIPRAADARDRRKRPLRPALDIRHAALTRHLPAFVLERQTAIDDRLRHHRRRARFRCLVRRRV